MRLDFLGQGGHKSKLRGGPASPHVVITGSSPMGTKIAFVTDGSVRLPLNVITGPGDL